jgi:hypothetical protein
MFELGDVPANIFYAVETTEPVTIRCDVLLESGETAELSEPIK